MIGGEQPKILANINEAGDFVLTDDLAHLFYAEQEKNWKLVRESDQLIKYSRAVIWIDWNEDGSFNSQHEDAKVNRSLIMSPFNESFTWQTTVITEIVESREGYIKFKTENSIYELSKIDE
jgi:hypothetical protein